jgi:hypothetical protein
MGSRAFHYNMQYLDRGECCRNHPGLACAAHVRLAKLNFVSYQQEMLYQQESIPSTNLSGAYKSAQGFKGGVDQDYSLGVIANAARH